MFYTRTIKEYEVPTNRQSFFHHLPGYCLASPVQTAWGWTNVGYAVPEADVLELDEQYLLEIALPGVVLDDIELKAEENCITVIAKRTPAMFEEKAAIIRKELPSGYLVRQFEFEHLIAHEQVEARMDRGILFVSIPKVEVAVRIPVSAGAIDTHMPGMKTRVTGKSETLRTGKEVTTIK
ncbi:MAG: Hsp20/alpha crystallin family protein [Candidatus Melainabacteria bacterium]|nr:Hsp20/alpha crystallin family protein [Candidatus Melainabacteria bacterium]